MKRKMLVFTAILTLAVLAFGMAFSVSADNTTDSGSCGEGVMWEFAGGMLTISGEGNMYNYTDFSDTPWKDYVDQINIVVINVGDDSSVENIGANAFAGCTKLTTVLAYDIKEIGDSAFSGCKSLTSLELPSTVSSIGKSAFAGCTGLTEFVIPEGITAIAESLFSGCSGLTKVVIPNSVTSIGASALGDCSALTHLVFCGTEQEWSEVTKASDWDTSAVRYHDCNRDTPVNGGTCSVCRQSIDPGSTLHRWNGGEVRSEPTHTEFGLRIYTCLDCGRTKSELIDKITEHAFGKWTYHDETKHKRVCSSSCEYTEYAEHSWDNGVITTPATHTAVGVKTYTCADCSGTKTETIAKLTEHTYGDWTYCSETQHKMVCACGDERFLDHTWNGGVVTSQPTHTEEGVKTYTCLDCGGTKTESIAIAKHTYGNWIKYNETQHKRTCACGDEKYADHVWNDGEVTAEPTHLVAGVKTYTCTDCGETKTEEIAKLAEHTYSDVWEKHDAAEHKKVCACGDEIYADHAWDDGKVTKEPTHLETGSKEHVCLECGEIKTETIAKLAEHTYGDWTKHNETLHKRTCACGDIQYVDHRWNDGEVTKAATHLAEGKVLYTCADCGETKTEAIAKSNEHTFGKWTQHDGDQHKRSCSCGAVMYLDHDYEKWTLITPATAEEAGERSKTCKVCGYVLTESIPALEEKAEGMSIGAVIGVTVSLAVLLGVGGFWFASSELLGNGARSPKKKKTSVKQKPEAETSDDPDDLDA